MRRLLRELETALASAAASVSDRATATAFGDFGARVRAIDAAADGPNPDDARARLPVCRFWEVALEAASHGTVGAIADMLGRLAWRFASGGAISRRTRSSPDACWRGSVAL